LTDIPESLRYFNRERYKSEVAQAIFMLMRRHGVSRRELAELLGVSKGRVSQVLSGDHNFTLETLADWLLVLGRTPHVLLATDFDTIRQPVDEFETSYQSSDGLSTYDVVTSESPNGKTQVIQTGSQAGVVRVWAAPVTAHTPSGRPYCHGRHGSGGKAHGRFTGRDFILSAVAERRPQDAVRNESMRGDR
jgi:transcriptional regulator with XRE-family HTH domain